MQVGIRKKLKLISLLPIVLLLGFASFFLYQSATGYLQGQDFSQKMAFSARLNDIATQLAKERGMTSIYLASSGKKIKESLRKQRSMTDRSIRALQAFLTDHPEQRLDPKSQSLLRQLPAIRQRIDKLQIGFKEAFFGYYTVLIKNLLNDIDKLGTKAPDAEIVNESKAYISLAQAKEASGIERGFMSYILTRYTKMGDDELKTWIHYIGRADTVEYNFIGDKALIRKIDAIFNNEDAKEIFNELAQARVEILHSIDDGLYTIDPTLWFNLNTEKISVYIKAQKIIQSAINGKITAVLQKQTYIALASAALWLIALILSVIGFLVSREITQNVKNLEKILQNVAQMTDKEFTIDLDTAEGTAQAYKMLQTIIDEMKNEQIRAEEASEAKSLFLANMSHEIRTPLNGIVGFTELLKNTELTDEQKEFVDIIEKSSENLLEIINNILDLSKIESNKVEIENIVFHPLEEFESAVDIYAVRAAEKQIDLACFIDPSLEQPLKGDPTKIKEVLINLLSNAVKFTNQGGAINVEIRRQPGGDPDKCKVSFSVEDTGIGITPDKKAHIFEAFSQADISVTRKYGGTGLGLTISAKYVELMGGKLELESEVGKGTRFFFTLELEELDGMNKSLEAAFAGETLGYYMPATGKKKKQDEYIREYISYYGADIVEFDSSEALFRLVKNTDLHHVLIDTDHISDNEIRRIGKSPVHCHTIIKSTYQKRIETLRELCERIIYEPVTATKILGVLEATQSKEPKKIKKEQFDFDKIRFKAKALVAEDNTINQKLITRTLEDLGLEVDLAANGLEAFEKRRNNNYDIIFMDISMPVMDGVEATHEILDYEEDEELKHVPIVALTANALKGDRERFLAEGLDEYTTKPLVRDEIIAILKKFLSDKIAKKEVVQNAHESAAKKTSDESEESGPMFDEEGAQTHEGGSSDEQISKKRRGRNVVVLKKSELEGKIFANLLESMDHPTEVAENFDDLLRLIDENVGMIFVDYERDDIDIEKLKKSLEEAGGDIACILMYDTTSELPDEVKGKCDDAILNLVNRDLIRLIIEKYMNTNKG